MYVPEKRRRLSAVVVLGGAVMATGGCGLALGDRECSNLISDAECGDWGRLYFTEATDDLEQLGGPPRPVAVGATYALRVGVEEFGAQGKDAGWVLEPRRLATAFPREDLFVIGETGEFVELTAVEAGTETLFVSTEESTRDRIQIQAIETDRVELVLGAYSGAPPGDDTNLSSLSQSDVGLLPGAWVELDVAVFDDEFRALAGYGLADWTASAGIELQDISRFSDRVRVTSTGALGGLAAVDGGEDLAAVFELVEPEELADVRVSLVDAFGTGATVEDDEVRVLVDRPVTISLDAYSSSGRRVVPAEDTPVLLVPLDGGNQDGAGLQVERLEGVGRFRLTPEVAGEVRLRVAYAGNEYEIFVLIE